MINPDRVFFFSFYTLRLPYNDVTHREIAVQRVQHYYVTEHQSLPSIFIENSLARRRLKESTSLRNLSNSRECWCNMTPVYMNK